MAGSASTTEPKQEIGIQVVLKDPRSEYLPNAKLVGEAFLKALNADPDLFNAFAGLAYDTSFMLVIASPERKRIIIP